jgi:hypothetical protein
MVDRLLATSSGIPCQMEGSSQLGKQTGLINSKNIVKLDKDQTQSLLKLEISLRLGLKCLVLEDLFKRLNMQARLWVLRIWEKVI